MGLLHQLSLGLFLAGGSSLLPAQFLTLDLHLAARRDGDPAAWQQLRRGLLGRLPGWPPRVDPEAALQLRLLWPWHLQAVARAAPRDLDGRPVRFLGELEIAGVGRLEGLAGFDGAETWRGQDLVPPRGRIAWIARLAGLQDEGVTARHMLPFIYHLLGEGPRPQPLSADLLQLAGPCETFRARCRNHGSEFELRSPAGGCGLVLPAILALVADYQARPQPRNPAAAALGSEADGLLMAALAGCGLPQQLAILQLGELEDSRSRVVLHTLLAAPDESRNAAIRALAGWADTTTRALVAAAAAPGVRFSSLHVAQSKAAPRFPTGKSTTRSQPGSLLRLHPQIEIPGLGYGPPRPGQGLPLRTAEGPDHHKGTGTPPGQLGAMLLFVLAGLATLGWTWTQLRR